MHSRAATTDQEQSFGIKRVYINGQQVLHDGALVAQALKTTGRAIPVK